MKFRMHILTFVLSALPLSAFAQCSDATQKPMWDAERNGFQCTGAGAKELVQPVGDKVLCSSARQKLEAVCPAATEGKSCRNEAKSIYNTCTKKGKGDSEKASQGLGSSAGKTDSSTCMTTFQQQQQACNARRLPPPAPGQPIPQDTCLQDALAAQSKCLANSR
jgi:hypothetical protein